MRFFFLWAIAAMLFTACNDSNVNNDDELTTSATEEIEERNKQRAIAALEAINHGNIDSLLAYSDKNMIEYGDGTFPPVQGADSVARDWKVWLSAVPDYKGENLLAVADGDIVMVYGEWSGTWKAEFMGMKPSNKKARFKEVDIFKFNEEGKIIEHKGVQSTVEIARRLGIPLPPEVLELPEN